jgi:ClpP class serine protease
MGITDLFWLFIIISALQPMFQKKILEMNRLKLLRTLEKARGSLAIALVHRQETMSILGFPLVRYIDVHDSEEVLRAIRLCAADCPIDMIIHTPGGLVLAADQIAHALHRHQGKVTVFVPHYAMSGGTLIALAADEIVMDENAVLGPVDPQLGPSPATSVLNVLKQKEPKDIDDETLILADVAQKAVTQMRASVRELLSKRMADEQAEVLTVKLTSGTWTHDYPITAKEARTMGLPVSTVVPEEIYRFMSFFPQPTRTHASVEYIPIPHPGRQKRERTGSGNVGQG